VFVSAQGRGNWPVKRWLAWLPFVATSSLILLGSARWLAGDRLVAAEGLRLLLFALLALSLFPLRKRKRAVVYAFAICGSLALASEIVQGLAASRVPRVSDVVLDMAASGIVFWLLIVTAPRAGPAALRLATGFSHRRRAAEPRSATGKALLLSLPPANRSAALLRDLIYNLHRLPPEQIYLLEPALNRLLREVQGYADSARPLAGAAEVFDAALELLYDMRDAFWAHDGMRALKSGSAALHLLTRD
jgi:hypothetical protein